MAAVNVIAHAAEISVDQLTERHLPKLLRAAADISHDWALLEDAPVAATSGS